MNIDENILSKLTDEQKKRVRTAKSPEELLAVAKEAGYEMTQSELDAISGSGGWCVDCLDGPQPCKDDYCPAFP